jgi:hypothetical protein
MLRTVRYVLNGKMVCEGNDTPPPEAGQYINFQGQRRYVESIRIRTEKTAESEWDRPVLIQIVTVGLRELNQTEWRALEPKPKPASIGITLRPLSRPAICSCGQPITGKWAGYRGFAPICDACTAKEDPIAAQMLEISNWKGAA